VIFVKELDELLPSYQARIPIEFEVLPSNLDVVVNKLTHIPSEHIFDIEQRLRNGDYCFAANHKGQIIHIHWIAVGKCYSYLLDREYELATDEGYAYSAYTLPEFRGNGIQPSVTCHRNNLLRDWGFKRVYGFMDPHSKAALRMPEKLNYVKVGYTGFIEVFGIRRYFHMDRGYLRALRRRSYWQKR
jgi:ribosomal protein S18 acetylase RimI-like enzyme